METQELQRLVAGMTAEQAQSPAGKNLAHRLVRSSLEAWCRFVLKPRDEKPAKHHKLILEILERVAKSEKPLKVMLLMPPGAAKSTYTSVCFPPWFLNLDPRKIILACSYKYKLIESFGEQCRDLVKKYGDVLGYQLSKTAQAAGDWRTDQGGGYFCAGVDAGIAGYRADLAFIDDYLGSEQDANSETTRESIKNWYRKDFVPRLKPRASRIIIANRRHEEDLVGYLLESEASQWEVIKIPMLAEDEHDPLGRAIGERLWPEWFTSEQVAEAKLDNKTWAGLYQQRPSPEDGNYFKKEYICEYRPDDLPRDLRYYVGADYALRKGTDNDRTCFLVGGVDSSGRLWVLPDWFWKRVDTLEATQEMLNMAKRRRPICWWAGRENITGSIAPFLYKMMQEQNIFVPIEELSEGKDKEQKAQPIKARMAAKMVMFPSYAPGWEMALHELLTFPNGKHDDFVDALSKLGAGLAKMVPASKTVEQKDWRKEWDSPLTYKRILQLHNRRETNQRKSDY